LRTLTALGGVVLLAWTSTAAGPLEGRWLLVEETYGTGGLNLARGKPTQTIELAREAGGLVARTRIGSDSSPRPWPAFVIKDTPAPVAVSELQITPAEDGVRARYTVSSFRDGDDMHLEVVEDYRVDDDGSLAGTVHVRFLRGTESRGSFVLHRRFERQP
jgi:hypothetical protein